MADLDQIGSISEEQATEELKTNSMIELSILFSMMSAGAYRKGAPEDNKGYAKVLRETFTEMMNSAGYQIVKKTDASS